MNKTPYQHRSLDTLHDLLLLYSMYYNQLQQFKGMHNGHFRLVNEPFAARNRLNEVIRDLGYHGIDVKPLQEHCLKTIPTYSINIGE